MLALSEMLIDCAKQAGISVPANIEKYDHFEYMHWHVLRMSQLGRAMVHGEHFQNAVALAKIPKEDLLSMSAYELQARGCNCGV